jgi:hypothetical protein
VRLQLMFQFSALTVVAASPDRIEDIVEDATVCTLAQRETPSYS